MQSLSWYYNRLCSMSLGEVLWRVKSEVRDRLDRWLVGGRQRGRADACLMELGKSLSVVRNGDIIIEK